LGGPLPKLYPAFAILVKGPNRRTIFGREPSNDYFIKILFFFIEQMVSDKKIFMGISHTIATKLWWNDPWMAPFQKCVRCSRLPTKMAAKLKIEKRGDEIF
jgi:hypothetical protein